MDNFYRDLSSSIILLIFLQYSIFVWIQTTFHSNCRILSWKFMLYLYLCICNTYLFLFSTFVCLCVCMRQMIASMKGGVQWCLQKLPFSINNLCVQIKLKQFNHHTINYLQEYIVLLIWSLHVVSVVLTFPGRFQCTKL